jgi:hypothetical protein
VAYLKLRTLWARRSITAIVAVIACFGLLSSAVSAGALAAPQSVNAGSPAVARSASTAARHFVAARTGALHSCLRERPGHCATARRALREARRALSLRRAQQARFVDKSHFAVPPPGEPAAKRDDGSVSSTSTSGAHRSASGLSAGGSGSSQSGTGSSASILPPIASAPTPIAPTPVQEAPSGAATTFQAGINSGWDQTYDVPGAAELGAKLVRLDVNLGQTAQEMEPIVAAYAAQGIRVMPLVDFGGAMPTPEQAQSIAGWAKAFGPEGSFWADRDDGRLAIQSIEFGNETSYSYQYSNDSAAGYASRAQTYALRFAEAASAIHAVNPGVGLLAQGDAGNAGSLWVENMFKAVPNLGQLVAGWTIHPYGPGWRARLQALMSETAAQGAPSTIPVDITEWGLATDNGQCLTENYGWNKCMTYGEAGAALSRTVGEMHETLGGRFGMLLLYQIRDQQPAGATNGRESYFGALQHELQPKGSFTTAVEELLAS